MPDLIGPGGGCIVAWILLGFCGMRRPVIVVGPIPPQPDPDPPDTMTGGWVIPTLVAIVAGVAGGWAFHELFAIAHDDSAGIIITFVGAFAAARAATDLLGRAVPRMAR